MRELINTLRDLLDKHRGGTATFTDWLKALDVVIHIMLDERQVIGDVPGGDQELLGVFSELSEEVSGDGPPAIGIGPVVTLLLPMVLKFLLEQVLKKT